MRYMSTAIRGLRDGTQLILLEPHKSLYDELYCSQPAFPFGTYAGVEAWPMFSVEFFIWNYWGRGTTRDGAQLIL
jgi:hypothetical protein